MIQLSSQWRLQLLNQDKFVFQTILFVNYTEIAEQTKDKNNTTTTDETMIQ
jgi:hypothetical protein